MTSISQHTENKIKFIKKTKILAKTKTRHLISFKVMIFLFCIPAFANKLKK